MLETLTFAADDWSLQELEERIGDELEIERPSTIHVTFLDTFDWRLFKAGCRLTRERRQGRSSLHWSSPDRESPYVLPTKRKIRFAEDLPSGFLQSEVLALSGVRALLEAGAVRTNRQSARVLDPQGNTVAVLVVDEYTPLDASNRAAAEPLRTVTAQPLTMDRRTFERVIRRLRKSGIKKAPAVDALWSAAEARGRLPGDYVSKPNLSLDPDQRCDEVLKQILDSLRMTLAANVDGVLDDVDTEFLHDLRVASRRGRAALGQMKKVLPRAQAQHLQDELRWIGEVTNLCRDLDVYLLQMDGYRRRIGNTAAALDDFERLLRRERSRALRRVRTGLRSKRFSLLMEAWAELVASDPSDSDAPLAARPISEVAGAKILRAYRRMLKRGAKLTESPPAADLHRLRIDGKKLRYLLEFFGGLWPGKTTSRLVKELKAFQDILGGFNDMTIQQRHLAAFAEKLMADGSASAETVFAMGRLADAMAAQQENHAEHFSERFRLFSSDASQTLYRETFGGN